MSLSFQKVANGALDIFYPRNCLITGGAVEGTPYRYLSEVGLQDLTRIVAPWCQGCGMPFFGLGAGEHLTCENCRALRPAFHQGRSIVVAKGAGRAIVHELKYHCGFHMLPDIAQLTLEAPGMERYLSGVKLVPVPLHARKLRERGFNQSLKIAEALAESLPGTTVEDCLERTRDTGTQTHLDRDRRRANVKNAFALGQGFRLDMAQTYIIVDDVCTTGATLDACAEALVAQGAQSVNVLTFAHG